MATAALKPHKETSTRVELVELTPELVKSWKKPDFQRDLRVNAKVLELVDQIKKDECLPGIITIGVLDKIFYKLDGQHRLEAFLLSKLPIAYCDVRYYYAEDMAEMGEEFVRLNSSLVRLRPDDILRGLEGHIETLQYLRKHCPFVGYDMIRRGAKSPVLSMSVVLRCWALAMTETPTSGRAVAAQVAKSLTPADTKHLAIFLQLAEKAWGRDPEYARLYSTLTLTLCMWLFRRIVIEPYSAGTTMLTPDQFQSCLTALSADARYLDYIVGRKLSDRDRSPAYNKIKAIFQHRYKVETKRRAKLPQPSWASHGRGGVG